MPHKAFLKKKSLLDRFKDNYKATGFIQSARAEHTWNNPITRRKRTKELNVWIKSFAGKRHIHKLARFNAMQAGKNESADCNLDCLRYGSTLELPNGMCVPVKETIRCPRRAAFVFRVLAVAETDDGFVIHGFYPVYGLERQPSEEFDIHSDDASELMKWADDHPDYAQNDFYEGCDMKNEERTDIKRNLCFTFNLSNELSGEAAGEATKHDYVDVTTGDSTDIYVDTIDELVDFFEATFEQNITDEVMDSFRYATVNCKRSRLEPTDLQNVSKKWGVRVKTEKGMNSNGFPEYEVTLIGTLEDVTAALSDIGF